MATLTVSDNVKAEVEARAAAEGFHNVEQYLKALLEAENAGAPPTQTVESDDQAEALLLTRLDGPEVEMDAADFARMREKFRDRLDGPAGAK